MDRYETDTEGEVEQETPLLHREHKEQRGDRTIWLVALAWLTKANAALWKTERNSQIFCSVLRQLIHNIMYYLNCIGDYVVWFLRLSISLSSIILIMNNTYYEQYIKSYCTKNTERRIYLS